MTRNLADVLQVQRRKALSFPVSFPGSDPEKGIIPYIKLLFCPNGQPATGYQRKKEAKKEAARATLPLRRDGDPFSRSLALAENTTYKTPLQQTINTLHRHNWRKRPSRATASAVATDDGGTLPLQQTINTFRRYNRQWRPSRATASLPTVATASRRCGEWLPSCN